MVSRTLTALCLCLAACAHRDPAHVAALRALDPVTPPAFILPSLEPGEAAGIRALRTLNPLPVPGFPP